MKRPLKHIESQSFNQWWIWLLLVVFNVLFIIAFVLQIFLDIPFGNKPAPDGVIVACLIFSIGILVLFRLIKLKTTIDSLSIKIAFGGMIKKKIEWNQIERYEIVDYGYVGGWGIRYSVKYGKIYSTGGSKGLFIVTKTGKKLVIGTKKPNELLTFLEQLEFAQSRTPHK